ncbi:MAG: hypothetical protein R6U50_11680 [Desulfobacterales bacterium]
MERFEKLANKDGIVLVSGLMILALLLIIGATAYMLSSSDVMISANYKHSEAAFADAEAGIDFAKAAIENHLEGGGNLPANVGDVMAIPATAPSGFLFSYSNLEKTGNNAYTFTSTGNGPQGATASIITSIKRKPVFDYAVFGDEQVDLKSSTGVFSYNSSDGLPDPDDASWDDMTTSTGNGDVGSNGDADAKNDIILNSSCYVDGDLAQGADGSPLVEAVVKNSGGVFTGETTSVGPVDTDPLDIVNDSDFLNKFADYEAANDNASITEPETGAALDTTIADDGVVLTGPGDYYFDSIQLGNGDTLTIDASSGPINIWVRGPVLGDNGSEFAIQNTSDTNKVNINVTEPSGYAGSTIIDLKNGGDFNPGGHPSHVMIKTDSDATVSIHNGNDTRAVIYAPFAHVDFDNGSAFYGAVLGKTIALRNSMKVYYDETIKDLAVSKKVELTSWYQKLE